MAHDSLPKTEADVGTKQPEEKPRDTETAGLAFSFPHFKTVFL